MLGGMNMVDTRKRIGRMVSALASAHGIQHIEMAAELGIHRNSLSEKVAGKRRFTDEEIVRLAEMLGVPPGRLFDDPVEMLGATEPRRRSSGRSPSAGSGSSPRRSGCFPKSGKSGTRRPPVAAGPFVTDQYLNAPLRKSFLNVAFTSRAWTADPRPSPPPKLRCRR